MKSLKLITALFLVLSCSFLVSGLYAGDSMDIPLNITNPIYTVTDNSSNLKGLNITYSDGIATIHTNPLMKPDNFTIIFMNQEKEVVHKHHHHGGGTNTIIKYKNRTINNTEYIEIPVSEEDDTKEENKTDNKEPEQEKEDNLFWRWIIFGFVASLLVILILREMRKPAVGSDIQKDERRLNNNGRKEQEETEE